MLGCDPRCSALIGIPETAQGMTLAQAHDQTHPYNHSTAVALAEQSWRTGEPSDRLLRYSKVDGWTGCK